MAALMDRVSDALEFLNYNFEKYFVSKFLGNLLLGHEVSGYVYQAEPVRKRESLGKMVLGAISNIPRILRKKPGYEEIKTSLTLKYREKKWGLERIVLDTVSNHFPEDSKGTAIAVEYLQDGEWVDFRQADKFKPVDSIRVRDDGKGYDYKLLDILYSTKTEDGISVGQWGEGLKLVAAACLRKGINIEYRSRDWSAAPFVKEEQIEGQPIQRLCFRVEKGKPEIQGSVTTFDNPSHELIKEIDQLSDNVLVFNNDYEVLYAEPPFNMYIPLIRNVLSSRLPSTYSSRIIDLKNRRKSLFVKGIKVKDVSGFLSPLFGEYFAEGSGFNSIFSYDLGIDDISPDRQIADQGAVKRAIKRLLEDCENTDVHRRILAAAHIDPDTYYEEYNALNHPENTRFSSESALNPIMVDINNMQTEFPFARPSNHNTPLLFDPANRERWKKVFREVFGGYAVLPSTKLGYNEDAEHLGYKVIRLNRDLENYLKNIGVETADSLFKKERKIKWVNDLKPEEAEMLSLIPEINRVVLGRDLDVSVSVYEGEYTVTVGPDGHLRTGELVESEKGFYRNRDPRDPEKDVIGIRRTQFQTRTDFISTYIHELGHKVTGSSDYDRAFTDFFVTALAKLTEARLS